MNELQGKRILVTRPAAQSGKLAEMIVAHGGVPELFPVLEIRPVADLAPLRQAFARLDGYALVVFISPNAVEFSVPIFVAQGSWPATVQVAAIGQSTAGQLAMYGIEDVIVPSERFDSEALLELPAFQVDQVVGKKILILRGNGGRELLADCLRDRGALVECVSCYQRSAPIDGEPVLSLLRNNRLDALTISSSEGLHNLLALLDTQAYRRLRDTPLFVPHQRIADVAAELGLQRVILTNPADAGIVKGLCEYNWLHHE